MNENDAFFEELNRDVDADHRRIHGADGPPAHMWQTIRAKARPESKQEEDVMTTTPAITHSLVFAPRTDTRQQSGFRHTLSFAASFLVVVSVALGGWFATMQLNSPNGSDGVFGLLGQSDGEATCDVEPMTVDEVMAIVRNPYSAMEMKIERFSVSYPSAADRDLAEPIDMRLDLRLLDQTGTTPDEYTYEAVSARANDFLACLESGTVAQLFRFLLPVEVQRMILSNFPVFRDEGEIRKAVEELIVLPAHSVAAPQNEAIQSGEYSYNVNPDRSSAKSFAAADARMYDADRILAVGIRITDSDGQVVFQNDSDNRADPIGTLKTTDRMRIVIVQSMYDGEWYVYATIPD